MLIDLGQNCKEVQLGHGDVNVVCGTFTENNKIAYVGFRNQKPKPIGTKGKDTSDIKRLVDMPIVLTFYDHRSIDVVIRALKQAKELMLEQEG